MAKKHVNEKFSFWVTELNLKVLMSKGLRNVVTGKVARYVKNIDQHLLL